MNITLVVKLDPSLEQRSALLETMKTFNTACDAIAEAAFAEKTANKVRLQQIVYRDIRERFSLSSQMTIRAIAKVCEVYKRDKTIKPSFKPHGAIVYDQRIHSWKGLDRVSLLTMGGREIIPTVMGPYQEARFGRIRGQSDLVYRDGTFFLHATLDIPDMPAIDPKDFLGVDLGIKNLAADSDGETHTGAKVRNMRNRHHRLRKKLQTKGTKSAKRLLRKRKAKEQRFARDVNHCISKRIVQKAYDTCRGIAVEDLTGIRYRVTVRKQQRRTHHSWAFYQLRQFITYKAAMLGMPVLAVDPRNTSRQCPECGVIDKANRPTRDSFHCQHCGHSAAADTTAARNIAGRARVMWPNAVAA